MIPHCFATQIRLCEAERSVWFGQSWGYVKGVQVSQRSVCVYREIKHPVGQIFMGALPRMELFQVK